MKQDKIATNKKRLIVSWIVYDMANTTFYAGVVGVLFPLWITNEFGANDADFGFTIAIAMSIVLIIAPVLGALSDQIGRRMPFLTAGTLMGIVALLLIGGNSFYVALALFALAFVSFNMANVFYNTLLSYVSTERNRGTISGFGTGLGYVGAAIAVAVAALFADSYGYILIFRITAGLILLLALPLLIFGHEPAIKKRNLNPSIAIKGTFYELKNVTTYLKLNPRLARYFFARFWYTWAAHTSSVFVVLYATKTVGLTAEMVQFVVIVGILTAIPSGILWGIVVDKLGPRRQLSIVLPGWIAMLLLGMAIPLLNLPIWAWWFIGVSGGVWMAGLWTADRPFLLRLTESEYLGELFGLHATTGRLASIAGPFVWGIIAVTWGLGQIAAMMSLVVCVTIAFLLVRSLSDTKFSLISTEEHLG